MKYDWKAIEKYVRDTGRVDYSELSSMFGVPRDSLRQRARKNRWKEEIASQSVEAMSELEFRHPLSPRSSSWDRVDRKVADICWVLLDKIQLHLEDDEPMGSSEIQKLSQAAQTLAMLARSAKGDIGCAIDTFAEAGLMPDEYAPQLVSVLEETEATLKDGVRKVFMGNIPD